MNKIRAAAALFCMLLFAVGIFALQVPGTQPSQGQTGTTQAPQTAQPPQATPPTQSTPSTTPPGQAEQSPSQAPHTSNIDDQVKILSSELSLTPEQQDKVKNILTDQHQQAMTVVQDNAMSRDDKLQKIHSLREVTITKVRQILTADQQPKFDQMIANMRQRQEGGGSPGGNQPSNSPGSTTSPSSTPPTTTTPTPATKPPQ
jgi:periplasmic protein CpxP/Spy